MPIPHVALGMPRAVIIFKQVDNRHTRIQIAQEQGAAEAAVADDQIRPDVGPRDERFVYAVAIADRVFERSRAEVRVLRRAALTRVLHFLEPFHDPAWRLADEGAFPSPLPRKMPCDVPKLSREILVDVEYVHA